MSERFTFASESVIEVDEDLELKTMIVQMFTKIFIGR